MDYIQKPKFYAYCRESIDLVSGIEIQKEEIKKYANAYDINIIKWYVDNDHSAYSFRPSFEKMWGALDECDGIIVNDLSRFGRNDSDVLFRFNVLKDKRKRIIFIKEHIDNTNPESEFFMKLLAIFADRERRMIKERLAAGQAYARIHGTKSGKPMHRPMKAVNWKQYDEYTQKGLSIPSIAKLFGMSRSKLYSAVNKR